MHLYTISAVLIPFLGPIYFWLKSELPITRGIFNVTNSPIIHLVSNFRAWSFFSGSCCYCVVNSFMITCHCLKSYTLFYCYSVNRTLIRQRPSFKTIQIYRHLQIFERCLNLIYSSTGLMTIFQLIGIVVQIFSCYLFIKLHSKLNMLQWILIVLMGGDSLVFNGFVFGVAAKVNESSKEKLLTLKRKQKVKKNHLMKRFYRSCPSLKIGFGVVSYIENLTPLAFLNFNFLQTVSLIMLQ